MLYQSDARKGMNLGPFEWFLRSEVLGSIVLLLCTLVALFWANSPWSESYLHLLHTKIGVAWGEASFASRSTSGLTTDLWFSFFLWLAWKSSVSC